FPGDARGTHLRRGLELGERRARAMNEQGAAGQREVVAAAEHLSVAIAAPVEVVGEKPLLLARGLGLPARNEEYRFDLNPHWRVGGWPSGGAMIRRPGSIGLSLSRGRLLRGSR